MQLFQEVRVKRLAMESTTPPNKEILDEDLQIIRVTFATIADDIRYFSPRAAEAVQTALVHLDEARKVFNRPPPPAVKPSRKSKA